MAKLRRKAVKKKAEHRLGKYVTPLGKWGSEASYPALPIAQNNQRFFILTIPVQDVFPFCFVARRDEDPAAGFQRTLNEERARDIANYLDDSRGSIPTNIVLSAQESAELKYNSRSKTVQYIRSKRAFLVLDGQHRLFGYGLTRGSHRVPVAIYSGLTRKEEAALFIDINTNQRGVPAALLLDIKQVADAESKKEVRLREIFDELNSDPASPLNGLLSPSKSLRNKISRVAFNRAMESILDSTLIQHLTEEKQYRVIRNFFVALEANLANPNLLRKASYFEAFCSVFDECIRISKINHGNIKLDSLSEVLEPIRNYDLEMITTGGRTKLSKGQIAQALKAALAADIRITDEMI